MRYKDCNECLKAGVPAELLRGCLESARDFAPAKVMSAREFYDEYMAEWFDNVLEPGLQLPWNFPWRVRSGELTVWLGIEGSGKSTLLDFVLVGLMAQGERCLLASYEVLPKKTLKKLSRQAFGGLPFDRRMLERCVDGRAKETYMESARSQARSAFEWLGKKLWLYNHVGIGSWRELIDDMRWARRRHGITQFGVDNFMRLGIAKDDYAQQAEAITEFAAVAMDLGIHAHIVLHQNKSEGRKDAGGGKRTASGAFEIIANAHNIVEVTRDERKAQQVSDLWEKYKIGQVGEGEFNGQKAALELVPDGKFILHKQRDGEYQNGSKYLWFLWEGQQYADKPPGHREHGPLKFVKMSEGEVEQGELPTSEELGIEQERTEGTEN